MTQLLICILITACNDYKAHGRQYCFLSLSLAQHKIGIFSVVFFFCSTVYIPHASLGALQLLPSDLRPLFSHVCIMFYLPRLPILSQILLFPLTYSFPFSIFVAHLVAFCRMGNMQQLGRLKSQFIKETIPHFINHLLLEIESHRHSLIPTTIPKRKRTICHQFL